MKRWQRDEVGGVWVFALMSVLFRVLPHFLLILIAYPVSLFYFLMGRKAREGLKSYHERIAALSGRRLSPYLHFLSFSITLVEKAESWLGKIDYSHLHFSNDDIDLFNDSLARGQGVIALVSHVGSSELLRALSAQLARERVGHPIPMTCIVEFEVTDRFNSMLGRLNRDSKLNLMSTRNMDMGSIEQLERTIRDGGIVIIAADRASERCVELDFLGRKAEFPYGAFYLSSLIAAPSFFVTLVRRRDFGIRRCYDVFVKRNSTRVEGDGRSARRLYAESTAANFVENLEENCLRHPYQWYNFFEFWRDEDEKRRG